MLIHPQTGAVLRLAGMKLHEFDGTLWTAVETTTPALRSMAVDATGGIWLAGVDQPGYCGHDSSGQWKSQPLADRLPPDHRKIGRIRDTMVTRNAVWFATDTTILRWQDDAFTVRSSGVTGALLGVGENIYYHQRNDSLRDWNGREFAVVSRDSPVAGPSITRRFGTEDGDWRPDFRRWPFPAERRAGDRPRPEPWRTLSGRRS
jgi:hypothetical protein